MSVESRRVTKTEVWVGWESQVVNGLYPLRRFLGGSNHSSVFLTENKSEGLPNAAIKLVPADSQETTQAQLVHWGMAAAHSHPHLIRIFDVGRCQLGGRGFLFVVMEYAEQTLAQILPKRALSPDEARELLLPTLNALTYLHRHRLVQGQLKPSNVLVVNDQLKLASDTIRSTGQLTNGVVRTSLYDPPELTEGLICAAGDVWSLGITLVEALTQHPPAWLDERSGTVSLATGLPAPFVDTVRRCLNPTPANRPTVIELGAQFNPVAHAHPITVSQAPEYEPSIETPPPHRSSKSPMPTLAIAALFVIAIGAWFSWPMLHEHAGSRNSASGVSQGRVERAPARVDATATAGAAPDVTDAAVPAASSSTAFTASPAATTVESTATATATTAELRKSEEPQASRELPQPTARTLETASPASAAPIQPSLQPEDASGVVLHKELPDIARIIRGRIRGHVKVTVRVLVDPAGNVVGEFFENPGPSRYYAGLAGDAAGRWKFVPTDQRGSRVWLLRFEFTTSGATVQVAGTN